MSGKADLAVIVLGQFAIGSAALLARAGLDAGMQPTSLAAWRLTIGSSLVFAYLLASRRPKPDLRPEHCWKLVAAGVFLGVHFATWFASLNHISIAVSTLLVASCPVWAVLIEIGLWRRFPGRAFWPGLGLALAGLALVSAQTGTKPGGSAFLGCFWALAGAAAFAVYLLIVKPYQTGIGTARTVSWTYTVAAASMWGVAWLIDWPSLVPENAMGWTSAAAMAVLAQGIGHTSLNWSLKRMAPSVVGVATLLEPVFAAALAWPIFGEPISGRQAFGAMILLFGVAVVLTRSTDCQGDSAHG